MKNITGRNLMASALLGVLVMAGCGKTDGPSCGTLNTTAPASEVSTLRQYIETNKINAVADSRGFYYTISSAGNTEQPSLCSTININYVGQLTNGQIFDQANNATFALSGLIYGWQEGLPLIGKGGKIILYLPPSLAYGSQASGSIPPNSILVFTITLIDFN